VAVCVAAKYDWPMIQPIKSLPKIALVTGGARRIGRAITLALSRAGYAVAIHARSADEEAAGLVAKIESGGGRAAIVGGDLADHDQVLALVPAAARALGPLTLLVNNAGEFQPDEIGALDPVLYEQHFAVNLRAPLFLSEAFVAAAPPDAGPSIVNILDQRVFKPTPRFFSYTLTKHALYCATTTMAQAFAPAVRVNAVAPGPILPSSRQRPEDFDRQAAAVPLGRGPSPEDVAEAVCYLAGASSVTGQTIAVDGGQRLAWKTADTLDIEE
jgi:NAD(P)-dependent dehydrogenase (short-subunit alcohol dehydrogenase family)